MASNNFLIFNESLAESMGNTLSDVDYANNQQRRKGISYGAPANSALFNKVLRQATLIAWAMADIIKDTGANVSDGNASNFKEQLKGYFDNTISNKIDSRITQATADALQLYSNIIVPTETGGQTDVIRFMNVRGQEKQFSTANKITTSEARIAAVDSGITAAKLKAINDKNTSQDETLNTHGEILNTHGNTLTSHTTTLNNHGTTLTNHGTAITTLQGYFTSGVAKKAIADGDGNNIKNTYATKTEVEEASNNKQGKLTTAQLTALNNLVNGTIKIDGWTLSIVS